MKKLYILFIVIGVLLIAGYLFVRIALKPQSPESNSTTAATSTTVPKENEHNKTTDALDLQPLFINKLKELVHKGSNGLYNLSLDSLQVDVLQSTVKLVNAKLIPDLSVTDSLDKLKLLPNDIFTISFNDLFISNINLDDFITKKTIDLDEIRISNPDIEVQHQKRSYNNVEDSLTLYQKLMKQVNSITVKKIIVNGGQVALNKNAAKPTTLKNIDLLLKYIKIDSSTQYNKNRFLFAEDARFTLTNFEMNSNDDLYVYKVGLVTVYANEKRLVTKNVKLLPRYSKQQFSQKLKERKERMELTLPSITVNNIDWYQLLNNESFTADEINIKGGNLNIYLNRSLPAIKSKVGNYPHQMIMNIKSPVKVKKLKFSNFDLAYEEYNPKSEQSGTIKFKNSHGTLSNFTNKPGRQNKILTLDANTQFMGLSPLSAVIKMPLEQNKEGNFNARLTLGKIDPTAIASMTKPLGLFAAKKGMINKLEATLSGDDNSGNGKVLLLYDDLKIELFEKEADEEELDKKGLLGLLANTFVIKNNNPSDNGEKPREPDASFERNKKAGFMNLIWKTTLVGILKSVGADPKIAKKK